MTFHTWKMVFLNFMTFQDQWSPWPTSAALAACCLHPEAVLLCHQLEGICHVKSDTMMMMHLHLKTGSEAASLIEHIK